MVFVIRRFGFEVLLCTDSYFLVLGRNGRWNHKYWYSFDAERYTLWIQEAPVSLKRLLAMTIISFKGKLLKSQELNWGKIVSPTGSFTWRVWIVSPYQSLVILPLSSKLVKNIVYKEILYHTLIDHWFHHLVCTWRNFAFFKLTFHADDIAAK